MNVRKKNMLTFAYRNVSTLSIIRFRFNVLNKSILNIIQNHYIILMKSIPNFIGFRSRNGFHV